MSSLLLSQCEDTYGEETHKTMKNGEELSQFRDFTRDEQPNYVLLSIQEEPYLEIKSGKKQYEFRTRYQKIPTIVFVYVSRTVKKISAIMEFGTPIIGTDKEISALSEIGKPGSYTGMMEYLHKGVGYAIPVLKMIEIEPVSLDELQKRFVEFVIPQSYYMLNNKKELLDFLLSIEHIQTIDFNRSDKVKPELQHFKVSNLSL